MIKENIPDAEISYYNSYTDLLSALKADKIDGFAADEPLVKYMMIEDDSVDYLKDKMDEAIKNSTIKEEIDRKMVNEILLNARKQFN